MPWTLQASTHYFSATLHKMNRHLWSKLNNYKIHHLTLKAYRIFHHKQHTLSSTNKTNNQSFPHSSYILQMTKTVLSNGVPTNRESTTQQHEKVKLVSAWCCLQKGINVNNPKVNKTRQPNQDDVVILTGVSSCSVMNAKHLSQNNAILEHNEQLYLVVPWHTGKKLAQKTKGS